jgi:diamine N-acetyltransferase
MLIGKNLQLRAIEYEDLPTLVAWRNDPDVYQYFFEHEPLSLVMQKAWFEKLLQRPDEKLWIAETIEDHKAIGTAGLTHLDWRSRKAELSRILISPECRKRGLGRELINLALHYVFNHLNLNRLYCQTFADNQAAVNLYERSGFKREGLFRQSVFKEGSYRDVVFMAILREDYLQRELTNTAP